MAATAKRLPLGQRLKLRLINLYPPFFGAGIKARWGADGRSAEVRLRKHWWSRNFVGTHFGGSMYAMTDPFFVLLLFRQLGWEFVVWNKRSTIHFLKPGKGTLTARFDMPESRVEEIRHAAKSGEPVEPVFSVDVMNPEGEAVARIEQTLYVRLKRAQKKT